LLFSWQTHRFPYFNLYPYVLNAVFCIGFENRFKQYLIDILQTDFPADQFKEFYEALCYYIALSNH